MLKLSRVTKLGRNVHWMVIYKICIFGADRKSNVAARAYNVFWLVEILKIFLLETTKPIELWVTGHNFESWPPKDHSCHVCFKLTYWFQRRRLLSIFFHRAPKCLCICTGDSEISLNAKNVHWIILYQICVFGADLKFNIENNYSVFIRPILEYASEVWNNCSSPLSKKYFLKC
jgi:hypothetical protein